VFLSTYNVQNLKLKTYVMRARKLSHIPQLNRIWLLSDLCAFITLCDSVWSTRTPQCFVLLKKKLIILFPHQKGSKDSTNWLFCIEFFFQFFFCYISFSTSVILVCVKTFCVPHQVWNAWKSLFSFTTNLDCYWLHKLWYHPHKDEICSSMLLERRLDED